MSIPRIYQNISLSLGQEVALNREALQHVVSALRLKTGAEVILFNGDNHEYQGELIVTDKRHAWVQIKEKNFCDRESRLNIHLAQGLARGAKMDLIIQKAVELGVKEITPVFTEHSNVKLEQERSEKRQAHWQSVAISAAEQCGRNQITQVHAPISLSDFLIHKMDGSQGVILSPQSTQSVKAIAVDLKNLTLLVGPEGGLSAQEIARCEAQGFLSIALGPRILRTETAALVAVSLLQAQAGDLA